jgi:2,4-dienoyl-CoA reductase-like NADH-dependent reductase (Old Yellow Enzyme family)
LFPRLLVLPVDLSITRSAQAEHIINTRQADAILIAREFLREPYWPLCAAQELRQSVSWPVQLCSRRAPATRMRAFP